MEGHHILPSVQRGIGKGFKKSIENIEEQADQQEHETACDHKELHHTGIGPLGMFMFTLVEKKGSAAILKAWIMMVISNAILKILANTPSS